MVSRTEVDANICAAPNMVPFLGSEKIFFPATGLSGLGFRVTLEDTTTSTNADTSTHTNSDTDTDTSTNSSETTNANANTNTNTRTSRSSTLDL